MDMHEAYSMLPATNVTRNRERHTTLRSHRSQLSLRRKISSACACGGMMPVAFGCLRGRRPESFGRPPSKGQGCLVLKVPPRELNDSMTAGFCCMVSDMRFYPHLSAINSFYRSLALSALGNRSGSVACRQEPLT